MNKLVIMGCGAAPGVPSVAAGWGACNPNNPKNVRRRAGVYLEAAGAKLLIDTSPDIRTQLLDNSIRYIDAVLYTHSHADHLHGIDDLRDLNRLSGKPLNIYANAETAEVIRQRFPYLVVDKNCVHNPMFCPSMIINEITEEQAFFIKDLKIVPIALSGHPVHSTGYVFNDGEIVFIADCRSISEKGLAMIQKRPEILVLPLTTPAGPATHMGLDKLLEYVNIIKPYRTIINHMASECDYDAIDALTPANVVPAYDNMVIEI